MSSSGPEALKAMATISSGPIDISKHIEHAESAVSGKPALQALLLLALLHRGAKASDLEAGAKRMMEQFPLSSLIGASHYSSDGRVIAKTSGDLDAQSQATRLFATMVQHYMLEIELVCRGSILPATATIVREHTVRRSDLLQVMRMAPIIPPGRAEQFAKGLWEGFEHDFATATYLLAPQVENLVRWHLKQQQVATTKVDAEGIENELGLSSLVEMPEVRTTFGEDLTFELKALFCSALGPNLRNAVAHGLLSAEECETVPAVYAWWWVLRLTLRSLHQATYRPAADKPGEKVDPTEAARTSAPAEGATAQPLSSDEPSCTETAQPPVPTSSLPDA